jgi:DNA-binding beta-propeller fold protein YncE
MHLLRIRQHLVTGASVSPCLSTCVARGKRVAPVLSLILVMTVAGCASVPATLQYEPPAAAEMVFPAPPDPPRYRYVGQLTGQPNFASDESQKESAGLKVLRWMVGLVAGKDIPEILQRPQGGMVDAEGRIYVADVSRQAVCVFDTVAGKYQVWDMATTAERFRSPISVVEGDNNEIWVSDSTLGYVVRLDREGKPLGRIGEGSLSHPTGLARDASTGRLFVSDTHAHEIKVFNAEGKLVNRFGGKGEGEGQFNSPTFLTLANDQLYVSDTMNSRIQVLTSSGEAVRSFGRRGLFVGNLPRPKGVAVDQNGLIYVVESYYDYLLIFNNKGELMLPIGGSGSGVGQFYLPSAVWVGNQQRIYVSDMFNGRIAVFEFLGEG